MLGKSGPLQPTEWQLERYEIRRPNSRYHESDVSGIQRASFYLNSKSPWCFVAAMPA